MNNPRLNKTIHTFYHQGTKETFKGIRYEFELKTGIKRGKIRDFVIGNKRSLEGWVILPA